MPALYDLVAEYRTALETLGNLDIDEQTFADTLESIQGEVTEKCTNIAMLTRNLETTVGAIKAAELQMATRRKAIENRIGRIRQYLLDNMIAADIQKIEHPMLVMAVKKNPPAVVIDADWEIPKEFWIQPPLPDPIVSKSLIGQAIKEGREVPGAHTEQAYRLDIK